MKDCKELLDGYRPVPFWSLNDRLDPKETARQIKVMKEAGLGGYFMHARGGLQTEYLSEEWFENIRVGIELGKELGMQVWVYDENGWPSGFGGGAVCGKGLKYQQKYLRMEKGEKNTDRTVANRDGFHFYYEVNPYYVDTLDPEVTEVFLHEIYDSYYERFGDSFEGVFTDEPQVSRDGIPWSFVLEKEYRKAYGEELTSVLPCLFLPTEGYRRVRIRFWRLVTELFVNGYLKQLHDWCAQRKLKLTGHLTLEESLEGQLTAHGACMPSYEYFDMPGMDWLGRERYSDLAQLQVCSAAHQLGKKKILTESFAMCGHDLDFAQMKGLLEWQMARGVNVFCAHLEGYSLRGLRKRDYPPAMYFQQPWWEEYRFFVEAMTRTGMLLGEGRVVCDTLLIHPQTLAWTLYDGKSSPEIERLQDRLSLVTQFLDRKHIPFHLGDELLMERHAEVEEGKLTVGVMSYRRVIVMSGEALFDGTRRLLDRFREEGGEILTVFEEGKERTGADGGVFDKGVSVAAGEKGCGRENEAVGRDSERTGHALVGLPDDSERTGHVPGGLSDDSERVERALGGLPDNGVTDNPRLLYACREFDDCMIHYYVNPTAEEQQARIEAGESCLDEISGELHPFKGFHVFEPCGSLLTVTTSGKTRRKQACLLPVGRTADGRSCNDPLVQEPLVQELLVQEPPVQDPSASARTMSDQPVPEGSMSDQPMSEASMRGQPLTGEKWKVDAVTDNSLPLDCCDYYFDGELQEREGYVLNIQNRACALGRPVTVRQVYRFQADWTPERIFLACETPERFEITVNGRRLLQEDGGFFVDRSIRRLKLDGYLRTGENTLELETCFTQPKKLYEDLQKALVFESEKNKITYDTEIEPVYLVGDFRVSVAEVFYEAEKGKEGLTEKEREGHTGREGLTERESEEPSYTEGQEEKERETEKEREGLPEREKEGLSYMEGQEEKERETEAEIETETVRLRGPFVIGKPDPELFPERIDAQGYPFFCGTVSLEGTFSWDGCGKRFLLLKRQGISVIRLRVNDGKETALLWQNGPLDITDQLRKGTNTLHLVLRNSLRNLMGPHHRGLKENAPVTPGSFFKEPCIWNVQPDKAWDPDYSIKKTGVSVCLTE